MYQLAALDAKLTVAMSSIANLATVLDATTYKDILGNANKEITDEASKSLYNQVSNVGNNVYQIILAVVTVILLIVVLIAGVSVALAPAAERSEAKKKLLYVIGGAVIVFAAVGIIGLIANFGNGLIPQDTWKNASDVANSASTGGFIIPRVF